MENTKLKINNPYYRNFLMAFAVAGSSIILFGLTFIFDAFIQSIVHVILSLFLKNDFGMNIIWISHFQHFFFVFIILVISYFIFKSKIATLLKAIYMTVPTGVLLTTIGIEFYQWPFIVYSLSILLVAIILFYFYKTKSPWIYYFSVIYTALALLIMMILGVEI